MYLSLAVAVAVQLATVAVAVLAASQHQTDTQFQLVKYSMYQLVQVALRAQPWSTAAMLEETVLSQASPAAVQESEVAVVKAVNVQ
jgi:hypothetical protein